MTNADAPSIKGVIFLQEGRGANFQMKCENCGSWQKHPLEEELQSDRADGCEATELSSWKQTWFLQIIKKKEARFSCSWFSCKKKPHLTHLSPIWVCPTFTLKLWVFEGLQIESSCGCWLGWSCRRLQQASREELQHLEKRNAGSDGDESLRANPLSAASLTVCFRKIHFQSFELAWNLWPDALKVFICRKERIAGFRIQPSGPLLMWERV